MSVSTTNVRLADLNAYGLNGPFRSTRVTSHPITEPSRSGPEQAEVAQLAASAVLLATARRRTVLEPEELVIGEELRERVARALAPDLRHLASMMGLASDPWGVLDSI